MSFVESATSIDDLSRIRREIRAPDMADLVRGKTPILPAKQLKELGFAVVAYPTMITYATARSAEHALAHLGASGTTARFEAMMESDEFNHLIGVDEIRQKQAAL